MSEEIDVALRSDAHLGEGPVWDDVRQELVWVDILAGRIHRFSPSTGGDKTLEVGQPVGAAGLRVEGGLVLALRNGFGRLSDEGVLEIVSEVESDILQNRMNDGKCDPAGRFWAGTMNEMHDAFCGALYRLDPDLGVRRMISGVGVSNGLDWSPDGTTMYYIDSLTQGVDAFDYDPTNGELARRRRLITVESHEGTPDGMTVDAEGYLWIAFWGGSALRRYTPSGQMERVVRFPVSRVTSCAFGGPDYGDLYVTTARRALSERELADQPLAGSLFRLRPPVPGRRGHRFTG